MSTTIDGKNFCYNEISNIYISKVLLPEQIDNKIKNVLLNNDSSTVYTNPDLCLEISDSGELFYEIIELKTTKVNTIPGSSVQQISPYRWIIFIKHNLKSIEVSTGKYIYSVNTKMQFPDRSPRPQVSFLELKNWNLKNRYISDNFLVYSDNNTVIEKLNLIYNWEDILCNKWIDIIFCKNSDNKKPWFNNVLRKFVIKFIVKYNAMTKDEQSFLLNKIQKLIYNN